MVKIRVLVASDYQLIRSALRQLLKTDDAFEVVLSETDVGQELPQVYQSISPDVLILESAKKSSASLRVPASILTLVPNARIILLSTNHDVSYVRSMFATGVLGYILKAAAQSELFEAVRHVHRGWQFLDPRLRRSVSHQLLCPANSTAPRSQARDMLSRREIEVLRAIALGHTTKEIAHELDLSEKTVQTYRERIYTKVGLHTRSDLVHYALAHGLGWETEE
ncbi:MAG TPA: response regulator transcription factor [Terriglobales bacterium]|nr:response regulator transcription factor [Terriglobales bacterium]